MRKLLFVFIIIASIAGGIFFYQRSIGVTSQEPPVTIQNAENPDSPSQTEASVVIAENFDTPWSIAFLPDRNMLVTERNGNVKRMDKDTNTVTQIAILQNVQEIGEGGLMGVALHPDFASNNFVYFYYTYESSGNNTLNRVVRMTYENDSLTGERVIIDRIPGASNHNGGRIKFGPDKLLYIATGDAQEPSLAQSRSSLAGKILRVTDDGRPAPGNPFNNQVFSYGHRNTQGIAWDENGRLWQTEHGRSLPTGFDEINFIEAGKNYGWPDIQGDETRTGMVTPLRNSGPNTVWAPGSAAFIGNSLFFGGLRGEALFEAVIENGSVTELKEHFKGQYGRIREVVAGPDDMLYMTTSNRDGRGNPADGDDKIIRINPSKL